MQTFSGAATLKKVPTLHLENRQIDYFFLFRLPVYFIESYGDTHGFFKKEGEQLYEKFIDSKTISEKEIPRDGALVSE